jgi:excinuclease ABC subunit B
MDEIRKRVEKNERILVTTLTKKMAEDLSDYLSGHDIRVRYLHSTIDTIERIEILRGLRTGDFDVLVGINLLREGLDLPEVSLVAILDADKEGFLRSEISLIQTIGRASRNINGMVIMYADNVTKAISKAVEETDRRRKLQIDFNRDNDIIPTSINKNITDILYSTGIKSKKRAREELAVKERQKVFSNENILEMDLSRISSIISGLEEEMNLAAKELDFEKAAVIRDEIRKIKKVADI